MLNIPKLEVDVYTTPFQMGVLLTIRSRQPDSNTISAVLIFLHGFSDHINGIQGLNLRVWVAR
jgi:hypothetical protein